MGKPILCVDFDGVIHSYTSPWAGPLVISDPPVKGAIKWLWKATEYFDVQIYSSRSKEPGAVEIMLEYMVNFSLHEFGPDHPMSTFPSVAHDYPITFAVEKPAAFLTIDDRAICFEGDWSELEPVDLLKFKPWNKRPLGATGTFSQGSLDEDDQGDIKIGIAFDPSNGLIRVDFGKPVAWMAMPPSQAIALANAILQKAKGK